MAVALHVRDTGSGRPVVLLHAFPLSSAMWLAQREHSLLVGRVAREVIPAQPLHRDNASRSQQCRGLDDGVVAARVYAGPAAALVDADELVAGAARRMAGMDQGSWTGLGTLGLKIRPP